jgi:type II secretory pathway predicted ATPase ExeA
MLRNDTLLPFSDESIEKIFLVSQGNTRRIISLCSQVLDASLDVNKKIIDEAVIDSVLAG